MVGGLRPGETPVQQMGKIFPIARCLHRLQWDERLLFKMTWPAGGADIFCLKENIKYIYETTKTVCEEGGGETADRCYVTKPTFLPFGIIYYYIYVHVYT